MGQRRIGALVGGGWQGGRTLPWGLGYRVWGLDGDAQLEDFGDCGAAPDGYQAEDEAATGIEGGEEPGT